MAEGPGSRGNPWDWHHPIFALRRRLLPCSLSRLGYFEPLQLTFVSSGPTYSLPSLPPRRNEDTYVLLLSSNKVTGRVHDNGH